jgi:hypothetical protein
MAAALLATCLPTSDGMKVELMIQLRLPRTSDCTSSAMLTTSSTTADVPFATCKSILAINRGA